MQDASSLQARLATSTTPGLRSSSSQASPQDPFTSEAPARRLEQDFTHADQLPPSSNGSDWLAANGPSMPNTTNGQSSFGGIGWTPVHGNGPSSPMGNGQPSTRVSGQSSPAGNGHSSLNGNGQSRLNGNGQYYTSSQSRSPLPHHHLSGKQPGMSQECMSTIMPNWGQGCLWLPPTSWVCRPTIRFCAKLA